MSMEEADRLFESADTPDKASDAMEYILGEIDYYTDFCESGAENFIDKGMKVLKKFPALHDKYHPALQMYAKEIGYKI